MTIKLKMDKRANIFLEEIGRGLPRATPRATALAAGRVKNRIKQEIRRFAKNPSGKLERSWLVRIDRRPVKARIFSPLPYAGIHDHGGEITGRPWLKIPLTRGARNSGRPFRNRIGNLIALRSRRGNLNLHPRGGGPPVFALKRKVRIKAKNYLTKAMDRSLGDLEKTYNDMAVTVIERAARRGR